MQVVEDNEMDGTRPKFVPFEKVVDEKEVERLYTRFVEMLDQ